MSFLDHRDIRSEISKRLSEARQFDGLLPFGEAALNCACHSSCSTATQNRPDPMPILASRFFAMPLNEEANQLGRNRLNDSALSDDRLRFHAARKDCILAGHLRAADRQSLDQ